MRSSAKNNVRIDCRDRKHRAKIRRLVLGHGLDRRRVYEIGYNGVLSTRECFTASCSGCTETSDGHNVNRYPWDKKHQCLIGGGCHECGYTGKRVRVFPVPVLINGRQVQIDPSMEAIGA